MILRPGCKDVAAAALAIITVMTLANYSLSALCLNVAARRAHPPD